MSQPAPRRAKIIATAGPATSSEEALRALLDAGAEAVRLNFSHGTHEGHGQVLHTVRRLSEENGRPVAVIQDLQGPKLRLGSLAGDARPLSEGETVTLTAADSSPGSGVLPIPHPRLVARMRAGQRVLLGDGEVELTVSQAAGKTATAEVNIGGIVKANQGLHLPGLPLEEPALTEKDLSDLRFGLDAGVDYVALSFVRSAADLRALRDAMSDAGRRLPVIAKLETREGIDALDEILAEADGVMVARGDLGLELGPEKVPLLQKEIIHRANERGVLAITATQMLESMIDLPRPTRAEASDVANAVLDGSDVLMLSGETAIGRYPDRAVAMMARIILEAETAGHTAPPAEPLRRSHGHAMSRAACELAAETGAAAVVVFTRSGFSARLVSRERPGVPVIAFTPDEEVYRQLSLAWGVTPVHLPFAPTVDRMIAEADAYVTGKGLLDPGDVVVVARWAPLRAGRRWSNFIRVMRLRGR